MLHGQLDKGVLAAIRTSLSKGRGLGAAEGESLEWKDLSLDALDYGVDVLSNP